MTSRLGTILGFALVAAAGSARAADQSDPNAPPPQPPPPNAQPGAPGVQVYVDPGQPPVVYAPPPPQPVYVGQPAPVYVGPPPGAYGGPPPGAYGGPPPQGRGYGPGPGGPGYFGLYPYLRGGFSINGGSTLNDPNGGGGLVSISVRVGAQFNPWLGLYYQNTPVFVFGNDSNMHVLDYNSLLLSLILFDHLELAAGPSYDFYSLGSCIGGFSGACGSGSAFGVHARVAVLFSWWRPWFRRRHGVSIGLDAHPMFIGSEIVSTVTLGLGFDWF